ncbi:MAG: CRISPR-associated endonuclease Cas2 [Parachlamydiales bacterium]|jgi:CRISPR-associated endonuclease Cas2
MKKNKREITKIILKGILLAGGIAIASTSPYFVPRIIPDIIRYAKYRKKQKEFEKKKFYNAFYKLKTKGFIKIEYKGKQIHVSLTKEGKKWAGRYQFDDLKIKKSRRWDKKWRLLIFDIPDKNKMKREALRGKLKELGLFQLQKSVWLCPYEFKKEVDILRSFFGLTAKEMNVILAYEIEDDKEAKLFFHIK